MDQPHTVTVKILDKDYQVACPEEQEAELVGEEMDLIHLLESRTCVPGERGPPYSADSDCGSKPNCVRCARSGFCTDQVML